MNCRAFREQLADFVAGELDAEQRANAQEHVQSCEKCRELARGLEAAAAVVEADVMPLGEAERQTASLAPPTPRSLHPARARRRYLRIPGLLRYAAVILLAFAGGYFVRGWQASEIGGAATALDTSDLASGEFANRYAKAVRQFPSSSTFAHSLLVLARP